MWSQQVSARCTLVVESPIIKSETSSDVPDLQQNKTAAQEPPHMETFYNAVYQKHSTTLLPPCFSFLGLNRQTSTNQIFDKRKQISLLHINDILHCISKTIPWALCVVSMCTVLYLCVLWFIYVHSMKVLTLYHILNVTLAFGLEHYCLR